MGRISIGSRSLGQEVGRISFYGQQGPGFSASRKLCKSVSTELLPCHPGTDLWARVPAEADPSLAPSIHASPEVAGLLRLLSQLAGCSGMPGTASHCAKPSLWETAHRDSSSQAG